MRVITLSIMNLGNIIFTLIFSLILILTEFIANSIWENYHLFAERNTPKELLVTFIISLIISFLTKKQKIIWGSFFIVLSFIQIGFFAYFKSYLQPYQINTIFTDLSDILKALSVISNTLILLIVSIIITLILINLFHHITKPKTNKYANILLIALMIIFPFIMSKKREIYLPNNTHLSYLNTLFAIDLFIVNKFIPNQYFTYKKYIVKKVDNGKPIIIVIMGESLNYKRMHLFGWDINNTPKLDYLAKTDKNFIFKKAISSGVNTGVCVPTFFYINREPSPQIITYGNTNLLKLAKDNNYKTYWFSMQVEHNQNVLMSMLNYADVKKEREDYKIKYDHMLLKDLKKIDFSKKSFVVLHFRANHITYESVTPPNFYKWKFNYKDMHKKMTYSYYNSILYVDYLISNIIDYMKKNHKNFIIYFVSDHGEMLGFPEEHGKYGHSQLDKNCAFIPFLYYSDKYHKDLNKKIYNHYLVGKMIAKDLGYEITNPNEDGTYYIKNVHYKGYIKYKLDDPPKILERKIF